MSFTQKGNGLPVIITDQMVAVSVARALHLEHAESDAAIKRIERVTGANFNSICKWYQGRNAPKSGHLLTLAAYYPEVLHALCELIGRNDLWRAAMQNNIPQSMHSHLIQKNPLRRVRGGKFATPKVDSDTKTNRQFNQRQVWFLEQLQQGSKLQTKDIMIVWDVHKRTAKRDVARLSAAGWIRFVPSGNTGWYAVR